MIDTTTVTTIANNPAYLGLDLLIYFVVGLIVTAGIADFADQTRKPITGPEILATIFIWPILVPVFMVKGIGRLYKRFIKE